MIQGDPWRRVTGRHQCDDDFSDWICEEMVDGSLELTVNAEYSTTVNYCPWCGKKATSVSETKTEEG